MVPSFKRIKKRKKRKINSIKNLKKLIKKNSNNLQKKVNSITAKNYLHNKNKDMHMPKITLLKLYALIYLLKLQLKSFFNILTHLYPHQIRNLPHHHQSKMYSSTKPKHLLFLQCLLEELKIFLISIHRSIILKVQLHSKW